jgi:hypothetical protein
MPLRSAMNPSGRSRDVVAFILGDPVIFNLSEMYLTMLGAQASARIKAQPSRATTDWLGGGDQSGDVVSPDIRKDQSAIQFATVQLFVAVYLQKFAVGPLSFQVSLPMLIMLGHLGFMLTTGRMHFAPIRLGCYLLFASSCSLAQAISGGRLSVASFVELLLIYSFLTVTSFASEAAYKLILKRFVGMMIIPALIVLVQYFYQKLTGLSDPISMNSIVPKSLLLQGFVYDAHYPWNSTFQRPNGFFFLEPSVISMFTASAAIIELTYFKRIPFALLMIGATGFSMGGTGLTMLLIASPFLLARQSLPAALLIGVAALIALSAAIALNVPLPLLSRLNELHQASSSGSGRLLIPAEQLTKLLFDPSFILTGGGAGSTTAALGNPWPVLKLINEYGLVTTILYVILYLMAFVKPYNVPLAIAISILFHFSGGYLLDAIVVQFMAVIFCMVIPEDRAGQARPHAYRLRRTV